MKPRIFDPVFWRGLSSQYAMLNSGVNPARTADDRNCRPAPTARRDENFVEADARGVLLQSCYGTPASICSGGFALVRAPLQLAGLKETGATGALAQREDLCVIGAPVVRQCCASPCCLIGG